MNSVITSDHTLIDYRLVGTDYLSLLLVDCASC